MESYTSSPNLGYLEACVRSFEDAADYREASGFELERCDVSGTENCCEVTNMPRTQPQQPLECESFILYQVCILVC